MGGPDWDADSDRLQANLARVLEQIRDEARRRRPLHARDAARWHAAILEGLEAPEPRGAGVFRGEPGLEDIHVHVGPHPGVPPGEVADALAGFEDTLKRGIELLDARIPAGSMPDGTTIGAVIDLCAWVHAEWVRIHPFVNGSGRTARLWANAIAMRYELPPFVRLRPRPGHGYGPAAERAMQGEWQPTARAFRAMLAAQARGE